MLTWRMNTGYGEWLSLHVLYIQICLQELALLCRLFNSSTHLYLHYAFNFCGLGIRGLWMMLLLVITKLIHVIQWNLVEWSLRKVSLLIAVSMQSPKEFSSTHGTVEPL